MQQKSKWGPNEIEQSENVKCQMCSPITINDCCTKSIGTWEYTDKNNNIYQLLKKEEATKQRVKFENYRNKKNNIKDFRLNNNKLTEDEENLINIYRDYDGEYVIPQAKICSADKCLHCIRDKLYIDDNEVSFTSSAPPISQTSPIIPQASQKRPPRPEKRPVIPQASQTRPPPVSPHTRNNLFAQIKDSANKSHLNNIPPKTTAQQDDFLSKVINNPNIKNQIQLYQKTLALI